MKSEKARIKSQGYKDGMMQTPSRWFSRNSLFEIINVAEDDVIEKTREHDRLRASLSFHKTCNYFRDNFGEMLCRRPNLDPSKCDMSCQMGQKFLDIYDNEK